MAVDPLEYRQIIGGFATGVTVVTASHGDEKFAMTANSVTSLSLEPCLLLICFIRGSKTLIAVKEAGWFGVNILHSDQEDLSDTFARTTGTFEAVAHTVDRHGVPLLEGTLGNFVCRLDSVSAGGDHEIVVGEVVDESPSARADSDDSPLLFYRGEYRRIGER